MPLIIRPCNGNADGFATASNGDTLLLMTDMTASNYANNNFTGATPAASNLRLLFGPLNSFAAFTASGQQVAVAVPLAASNIVAGPGTSAAPPFRIASGSVTTAPTAGALEFDGVTFYGTASNNLRGLVPTQQYSAVAPAAGVAVASPSAAATGVFGRAFTVVAGMRYQVQGMVGVSRTSTAASAATLQLSFAGITGSVALQATHAVVNTAQTTLSGFGIAAGTPAPAFLYSATPATAFSASAASASATSSTHVCGFTGVLDVATGTALTPQFTLSGAGTVASATVLGGSFLSLTPLSPTGSTTAI